MQISPNDPIVIVSAARTPMGGMSGAFAEVPASDLGAAAIKSAVEKSGIDADQIDEVIMGCVLQAGQGQAPARQAAIKAGLPNTTPCSTVNKMCGSGMKTVMDMANNIAAGAVNVGVAGGMESMTQAPYMMPKARHGYRLGHAQMYDHMFLDGLEDAYEGKAMGVFAEDCAGKYQFSREAQDEYALASLSRANAAIENGTFADEVTPYTIKTRKGEVTVSVDEQPGKAMPEKIPALRPAFVKDGTVTAANASSISDGAAAVVMMKQSEAEKRGLTPIAKIVSAAQNAHEPQWFTTAPVNAIASAMKDAGWHKDDVDLFEINEAFAVVPMAAMKELGLDHDKVNIHGGACALGHPIGASGTRIIVTLLNALKKTGGTKGVASLCIGGGEATALAVEMV